jgi:hypothetical protein
MKTLKEITIEAKLPAAYFYNNESFDEETGEIGSEGNYGWLDSADLEDFTICFSETESKYKICVICGDDEINPASTSDDLIIKLLNKNFGINLPLDSIIDWIREDCFLIGYIQNKKGE